MTNTLKVQGCEVFGLGYLVTNDGSKSEYEFKTAIDIFLTLDRESFIDWLRDPDIHHNVT